MTRVSFLRWKSNTNAPQKDAKQAQSNTGMVEGVRPGKSLSQIGLTGRAGFLPQHTCLWKAERESHALGTRSGNCLYMRVSNCSGIKRIRTWDANIAGIKGEKIPCKAHHDWEMEAGPGAMPWDGMQEDGLLLVLGNSLSSLPFTADFWYLNRNGRWGFLQNFVEDGRRKSI